MMQTDTSTGTGIGIGDTQAAFPVVRHRKLYHIGRLDGSKAGDSYEGAGVSVSRDPYRWGIVARLGHTPLWICEKADSRFLDNRNLTPGHRTAMAEWAEGQGLAERSAAGRHGWICTPEMSGRMRVARAADVYTLGFIAACFAEDVLGLDGVWWQQRFSGTDGPRGVIVPSMLASWKWTLRSNDEINGVDPDFRPFQDGSGPDLSGGLPPTPR